VFATGRWNDLEHYDIAILDLATRAVTRLTSGDATDDTPFWSPTERESHFTGSTGTDRRASCA
jgi:Tol biopolymer transport system component